MDRYHVDSRTITTSSYSHEYLSLKKKKTIGKTEEICSDLENICLNKKSRKLNKAQQNISKDLLKTKITSEKMCTSLSDFIIMNTSKYFPYG